MQCFVLLLGVGGAGRCLSPFLLDMAVPWPTNTVCNLAGGMFVVLLGCPAELLPLAMLGPRPLPLSSRGRWGWGVALILARQTRIYNINKINVLYLVDFIGNVISI